MSSGNSKGDRNNALSSERDRNESYAEHRRRQQNSQSSQSSSNFHLPVSRSSYGENSHSSSDHPNSSRSNHHESSRSRNDDSHHRENNDDRRSREVYGSRFEHGRSKSRKRGRDRSSEEAGPSSRPDKIPRREQSQGNRQKREEFEDQRLTRPRNPDGSFFHKSVEIRENELQLAGNFFQVGSGRISVFAYQVDFEPVTEIQDIRQYLIRQLQTEIGSHLFDQRSQLYSIRRLAEDPLVRIQRSREGQEFQVTLRRTREIHYTEGSFLQVLNLILRNSMRGMNLQLVMRSFFDPAAAINIPQHFLQIWPGYVTSIRQHEHNVLLCCEISHKVMRNETLYSIFRRCVADGGDFQRKFCNQVIGTTVLTDYNNKTYKVIDVDFEQNPSMTFETSTGPKRFLDYYREKYRKNILDRNQPFLVSRSRDRNIRAGEPQLILLVPELCRATGLSDEMRRNFALTHDISIHTRLNPDTRVERLQRFRERLVGTPESLRVLQENNMTISDRLVSFPGRQLETEKILFANNSSSAARNGDWTRDMQGQVMYREVLREKLRNWFFIFPNSMQRSSETFLRTFLRVASGLCGGDVSDPIKMPMDSSENISYVSTIDKLKSSGDAAFIMIGVQNNKSDRYAAIKKAALTGDNPVSVQVVTEKAMTNKRGLMSIATKVVIQVNCKLGGLPWNVNLLLKGILFIGFDTSHDTTNKRYSYGAMVASMKNDNNGDEKFFCATSRHESGQQLSANFGVNVQGALMAYLENYECLPSRILIYRDGVGDGQIQYVIDQELEDIKSKVALFYENINGKNPPEAKPVKPKLGFVIINKRTNTRIFKKGDRRFGQCYTNPPCGTVVDDVITMPERYDFYLISQHVTQGTVSPTYYNVIWDEFYPKRPDIIQTLTFKLCHLYYNWSGTCRIPNVVQYAKKLAFLTGQTMRDSIVRLPVDRQLYFL